MHRTGENVVGIELRQLWGKLTPVWKGKKGAEVVKVEAFKKKGGKA
jgi:hypothetical protein